MACSKPESEAVSEPQPVGAERQAAESLRGPDAGQAGGSDPTVVDPDHYTVEFENEAVRIVRITYGPGEESVMHYHPDSVAVFVTDHLVQMTMPDGLSDEIPANAGDVLFIPGGQHLPKNISDSAWELVLVELK
jgi:quercetin dioxygenase-like cupin family protein